MKRSTIALLVCALAAPAAFAQSSAPGNMQQKLEARFTAADTDHDGKLSKQEAQAGMPRVAKVFDQIDEGHTGYITVQQIEAFMMKQKK